MPRTKTARTEDTTNSTTTEDTNMAEQNETQEQQDTNAQTFKATHKDLGPVSVTVTLPEISDEDVAAYLGDTEEEREKNRREVLVSAVDQARKRAISTFLRGVNSTDEVTADAALASFQGLQYGKRRTSGESKARKGRAVKRTSADLNAAIQASGGLPTTPEELAALLASLNVRIEDAAA